MYRAEAVRLFSLETIVSSAAESVHDVLYILCSILFCVLKVILHDVVRIKPELRGDCRLLGIVDDQELIGAVLCGKFNAVRAESVLDPELGCVRMLAALEDCRSTDLEGCAGARDDQGDIAVAVVLDLSDAVMQEADADDALACTYVLGRAGAGLCIDLDVLVKIYEILWIIVLTTSLAVPAVL